jgi:hypothetical protein
MMHWMQEETGGLSNGADDVMSEIMSGGRIDGKGDGEVTSVSTWSVG